MTIEPTNSHGISSKKSAIVD